MGTLIETKNLKKYFSTPKGILHAVDDISFTIEEGKTVGVVGESGCGKSTLGRTILHLLDSTSGQILYRGEDITEVSGAKLAELRRKMQIIFQDPYSSVDPRMYIEQLIGEALKNSKLTKKQKTERVKDLMDTVGIPQRLIYSYPHELDGGLRQRVVIARALALDPEFVVCDEPVSALDVSIQAQILNLLNSLQAERKLTYMFITHDLSVVKYVSDEICVMYLGQMIEYSPTEELFRNPIHPYTKALLAAIPEPKLTGKTRKEIIHGEVTSPIDPPAGCRFMARCAFACEECKKAQTLSEITPGHYVSCCQAAAINK